jgi:hypothetical protein
VQAKASLAGLHVNINRITLAILVQFLIELQGVIVTAAGQKSAPRPEDPKQKKLTSSTGPPPLESTILQLDCKLYCVSLSLLKEGKKFFEARVTGLAAQVGLQADSSTSVSAQLQRFGCKDMYGSPWSETLSAGGEDEMAITMFFATFNPEARSYPGHDMEVGVKMASIKVNFTNRYVRED